MDSSKQLSIKNTRLKRLLHTIEINLTDQSLPLVNDLVKALVLSKKSPELSGKIIKLECYLKEILDKIRQTEAL